MVVVCAMWCAGQGDGLCENDHDVFGLLVGGSLDSNQISDVGATKIAEALSSSKLTELT